MKKSLWKERFKRGEKLLLALFCVALIALPAYARGVTILGNSVQVTPGNNAAGVAVFKDGSTDVWTRNITGGAIEPGGVFGFQVANDTVGGTLHLTMTASDANAPGGAKNRYKTLSVGYTEMGEPVDFPVNVTLLDNIIDAPPPITVTATQTGFNLAMKPVIEVKIAMPTADPFTGNYEPKYYSTSGYHYEVTLGTTPIESGVKTGASFNLDSVKYLAGQAYVIKAYAYNGYTKDHGGTFDQRVTQSSFATVAGAPGGPITIIYDFKKSGVLGVNQFAIPIKQPVYTKADKTTMNVTTVAELVTAINDYAAAQTAPVTNAVTTVGWWDEATQKPAGYTISYSGTTPNFADHTAGLPDDGSFALARDKAYQINVAGAVTNFSLTGNRD